jgi:hypothetical protein
MSNERKSLLSLAPADVVKEMTTRFASGNDVPVERSSITRNEWIVLECELERLETARERLLGALDAKQAKIDALMLEFCPGEMSKEQREEWASRQRPVPTPQSTDERSVVEKLRDRAGDWQTWIDDDLPIERGYNPEHMRYHQALDRAAADAIEQLTEFKETALVEARAAEAEIERLNREVAHLRKTCKDFGVHPSRVGYDANGSPVGGCIHCGEDH